MEATWDLCSKGWDSSAEKLWHCCPPATRLRGRKEQRTLEKSSQKFSEHWNVVLFTLNSANICMCGMPKLSGMLQLCKMHLQREFHMELLFLWCQTLPFFIIIKLNKASQRVKRLERKKGGKKRYFRSTSIQKVEDSWKDQHESNSTPTVTPFSP